MPSENAPDPCWLVDGVYRWTCGNGRTGTEGFVLRGIDAPTKEQAAKHALELVKHGYLKMKEGEAAAPDDIIAVEWVSEPEVSSFDPGLDL
jgi:hypothetical protein